MSTVESPGRRDSLLSKAGMITVGKTYHFVGNTHDTIFLVTGRDDRGYNILVLQSQGKHPHAVGVEHLHPESRWAHESTEV
jgi:hypothetical protein